MDMTSPTKPPRGVKNSKETSGLLMAVIRTLSTSESNEQRDLERAKLEREYKKCDQRLNELVSIHKLDLEQVMQLFIQMSTMITNTRDKLRSIKEMLIACKTLLSCRRDELKKLWFEGVEHKHVMQLLDEIEELKEVPSKLANFLANKDYLNGTKILVLALNAGDGDLEGVEALNELKTELQVKKEKLHEMLLWEISNIVYLEPVKTLDCSSNNQVVTREKFRWRQKILDSSSISNSFDKSSSVSYDIELRMLVECLGLLNKLNESVESIKIKMQDEILNVVNLVSKAVAANTGNNHPLIKLLEMLIDQLRKIALRFKSLLNAFGEVSKKCQVTLPPVDGADIWNTIQNVLQLLLTDYLDIQNTANDPTPTPGFPDQAADISTFFARRRIQRPRKFPLFKFEYSSNVNFLSKEQQAAVALSENKQRGKVLICPPEPFNITIVYKTLQKFIEEIESSLSLPAGKTCTLNTFVNDYVKDAFIGREYTSAIPAYQQSQVQAQNQPVQVQQQSHHRPLTRGGRGRGRGRGLMTRGGRGGNAVVHQVVVSASSPVSQSPVKVIQASPQKTFVVASPSHPRVIAQTINTEEEQTPKVVHRRTILTKLPQSSPQLKQQTLHQALHSSSPSISIAQDTGGTQTIITSTPIVIQRKVPITRGGRGGRGVRGGRSRKSNIASGDEVSAALQAMELTPPQSQPTQSPIVASPTKQQSTPQPLVEQEGTVKKKPTMPTVIIRKIGSKSEIISTSGKSNKVRLHSEENSPEQYAIIQPQQSQGNKTVKQVLVPKPVETTTPARVTAKESVVSEDPSSKKKKEKKAILASPPAEALGPELFSTPDIIRRVSTDKPGDGPAPLTPTQVEPKVQVQPTHPPFKPIINCDEMTPESLLDSIHAEVAAKDDSRLIAEALLLDDLTNDDSQSMSYPGKEKPDPARTAVPSQPQQQMQQLQTQNQASLDAQTPRIRKLPPIELPTTRSATKKAAASQQPNSIQQQQQQSRNALAQREKRQQVAAAVSEKRHSTEVKKVTEREKKIPIKEDFVSDFEDEEAETDEESWNSEDDPDRLWCICKKPHNNRFMICCDGCEEWFHGKCVGITKALGQQMESKGIEWSCPNCTQAKAQNNKKALETSKPATAAPSAKLSSGQQTISSLECIVCKKPAKVDSNYCTDLCVRKHALTMLALLKKETDGLQLNSRVVVYEKKSGKLLAGNAAPTVQILADWLLEHQTYEIAKPSVLPPNKFYKKPTQAQASPPETAQQKQQTPSKQEQQQESTTPKVQQSAATKQQLTQAKQTQPKATNQLKQQQQPEVKQLQQQSLPQAKQQPTQPKQTQQQPSQIQAKQQQSAKPLQPARPSVIKQSGNEKGGNLKQAVLTQKITASGTKEIGFAPKPSTPNKVQIIQAQPMTVQQPTPKAKAKEEDEGKSKKSAAKAIAQSPAEASTKRHSVDTKKPLERLPSKEDKRRDSVSSIKDKDEKKKEEKKKRKDSTSETTKPSEETTPAPSTPSVEPVRANVKRTLQDVLIQRVKQDDSLNISNDEIQELSNLVEEEMFALFKDTGTKYKSKYRSLIFNIKDPKNLTLYRKIVEKLISPTQLVRLSPEELASQELAQWREKEAKHQLEIIKKNELDLIHQAKTVVLKSRKGEEVIETKAINISELESALNRTADDYDLEKTVTSDTKEEEKSPEKKNDKKKEEHSSRSSDRKKKKEDRNRRDRSRSRRRSRSRSRDRDKKRKEKDDKPKEKEKDKLDDKAEETLKEIEEVISQHISIPPPPPSQPDSDLSDREPSSTVNISTPPLEEEKPPVWRGILNMSEVTKLYTSAYEVSGSCEDLGEELSDQLDCVGRIQPDSVWEYVSRMKKAGTKDIIVIRFHSDAEEEKMNYLSLYSYLNSRNRMAVIGQVSKTVKDFYVLPLASHSPIPQVLLPLDGPGFDDYRTHLLLGIIIRTKKGSTSSLALSSRSKKSSALVSSSSNRLERSYTPPLPADGGTPPTTPPPLPPFSKPYSHPPGLTPPLPDDDEPYSPGEDDLYSPEDNQAEAILVNPEIQRNLEEVNRMIEQKRQQIQSIAQAAAGTQGPVPMDEESPYSPSSSFTPPRQGSEAIPFLDTNDIKLPPNLQDILASIKGTPAMDVKSDPIVKAYTSQAFYEEEEEEEELKEEEKDVKSERTSRDPRQRPDPPKPKSALSQLSDSELIRKAAEMESEEKKEFKQPAYFYPAPPPVAVAVAPQPIYPPAPTHYKYPPAPAPPPLPPVVDKERKRKDKFKERRPLPPPISHPPRRKWDNGHHNRGMMQHRPPIRGNRPPRFRGGFDRGRGGFRGGGGGFRPPRGGGHPSRFRGTHGRDRNVQSEWDEEIRNFEQRKARERKRRASRSPSPRRRSLSPPRRRSRRASSNSS